MRSEREIRKKRALFGRLFINARHEMGKKKPRANKQVESIQLSHSSDGEEEKGNNDSRNRTFNDRSLMEQKLKSQLSIFHELRRINSFLHCSD